MPAIPAVTIRSHVTLDADPLRLKDESFVLMERARISASSANSQRFVDLAGNCFLRVESDQRLQYSIDFSVLQNSASLGDYYPGRALSDRSLAFATAGTARPHQFKEGGIFIYESSEDSDNQGELRKCSVEVSYDLHGGLDTVNYPTTSGPVITYTDLPQQAFQEVSDSTKNYLLQDIFYSEENLGGDFTVTAYNGNPASGGSVIAGPITLIDPWINVYTDGSFDGATYAASPNEAIVFGSSGSSRTCTHIRLKRGSIVICDVALAASLTIPAGNYFRIPTTALRISMRYPAATANAETNGEHPAAYFLPYVLGGTRFTHIPSPQMVYAIYTEDPYANPNVQPVDQWLIDANVNNWNVVSKTVDPQPAIGSVETFNGVTEAPASGWEIKVVIVTMANLNVHVNCGAWTSGDYGTVTSGQVYKTSTYPSLDMDY